VVGVGLVYGGWLVCVLTVLLGPALFPSELEEFVGHGVPRQYRSSLLSEVLSDYAGVQGVAHNSGNSAVTAEAARQHGADIIEVDVVSVNGELYASHDGPVPLIGSRVFPRPTLQQVWEETEGTPLLIDLKESSASYRTGLLDFLDANMDGREVTVSSRDLRTLDEFARRRPDARRLLSISSRSELERLGEERLTSVVEGVSIRQTLLDEETMLWLKENGLLVFAWVVNDIQRVNQLVEWGVDGITTDDLAILELLGHGVPFYLPDINTVPPADALSVAPVSKPA